MERTDLTTKQAEQVAKSLFRSLNFLLMLKRRMEQVGFYHEDQLYRLVVEAYNKMQTVYVEARSI